jgi:predicted RNA-binding Zn-ribbon protein involved in translation (DUF1610 family)
MNDTPTAGTDSVRMVCPHCKIETGVEITRYATASPRHIDLECRCPNCGVCWQAAEDLS